MRENLDLEERIEANKRAADEAQRDILKGRRYEDLSAKEQQRYHAINSSHEAAANRLRRQVGGRRILMAGGKE